MSKLSSRDLLSILRDFELANYDNVPRNIENVKNHSADDTSTLVSFRFLNKQYYCLLDESADDDVEYIASRIKQAKGEVKGNVVISPKDNSTYALPFKGKSCYLFIVNTSKRRLDAELASRYPDDSRGTWQKYIKSGYVTVNGKVVTSASSDVDENDSISILIPEKPDYSNNELPIIYIDDNVIVVNKPCGVLTHAKGVISEEFTVADFFKKYTSFNLDTNRAGIVHRLDRDTSGVIIGARNQETATLLQKQFADRKTKKTYYAIVEGKPKLSTANIDLPIGRNPSKPSTFKVDTNGKSAITKYEVVDTQSNLSLVKLMPYTGRTHQLRVHMKYINTPILGDRVYGRAADRLYLHASQLEITIPNGNRTTFSAPLPDEFSKYFKI